MHAPELALIAGAESRLGRTHGIRVDGGQRHIPNDKSQLPRIDIFLTNLAEGCTFELPAEGALVVGELDYSHRGVLWPERVSAVKLQLACCGRRWRS